MSKVNRGKQFEDVVRACFAKVPNVSIDRLHDQTTGFLGSSNIADLIVFREPYEYYFELKSVHGNTLSIHSNDEKHKYGNITNVQWEGLLEKSKIQGVFAGILVWWVDHDVTAFIPITTLQEYRADGHKSVRYDNDDIYRFVLTGKKKRVFFDYDMEVLLNELSASRDT